MLEAVADIAAQWSTHMVEHVPAGAALMPAAVDLLLKLARQIGRPELAVRLGEQRRAGPSPWELIDLETYFLVRLEFCGKTRSEQRLLLQACGVLPGQESVWKRLLAFPDDEPPTWQRSLE